MESVSATGGRSRQLQPFRGGEFLKLFANRDAADRLVEERQQRGFGLARVEVEQQCLHRTHRGRRQRQRPVADCRQRQRANRLRGEFAAQRHRLVVLFRPLGDVLEGPQHRSRQRIEAIGHADIAAVGSVEELHQVVRTD